MNVPIPFVLITHSMGGLLARAALAADKEFQHMVKGVVHICQPCFGAPVLYRRLFSGCSNLDENGWIDRLFCRILGKTAAQVASNLAGLPGALQLLPSVEYEYPAGARFVGWDGATLDKFVYETYGNDLCPPGIARKDISPFVRSAIRNLVSVVNDFHAAVRGVFFKRTWFLFGTGRDTDLSFHYHGSQVTQVRLAQGDGTVPVMSAAPGMKTSVGVSDLAMDPAQNQFGEDSGAEHSEACNSTGIVNASRSIVRYLDRL